MNIKQLETFYWIERLGSFSAAADKVFATQSTVSMRIHELEESLGVKLFDRTQRTAKLTSKGKELVPYVRQLIELTSEMQEVLMPKAALSGLIRVGVIEVVALTWLPEFIKHLRAKFPLIRLELSVGLANELNQKMANGDLDLIFTMGRAPSLVYETVSLGSITFDWVIAPQLKNKKLPLEIFKEQPLIILNKNSFHFTFMQKWMRENKIHPKSIIECNSMTVIAILVKAGLGISLIPMSCYPNEFADGSLLVIKLAKELQPIEACAIYMGNSPNPIAQAVAEVGAEVSKIFNDEKKNVNKNLLLRKIA